MMEWCVLFVVASWVESIVLSGEIGPKKGRKKCIYMYIYIGVYSVVACVEPTHDGVPNE